MSLRAKLEKRIKEKESEIRGLEVALMEARAYLQATEDALHLLTKVSGEKRSIKKGIIRSGTILDQAIHILKRANKPMQIMELLTAMGKEQTPENRQALVGSIGAYARKGAVFVKTGPNTFGLLEWEKRGCEENRSEPPENFGLN